MGAMACQIQRLVQTDIKENKLRITGPFHKKFTGHRWIAIIAIGNISPLYEWCFDDNDTNNILGLPGADENVNIKE